MIRELCKEQVMMKGHAARRLAGEGGCATQNVVEQETDLLGTCGTCSKIGHKKTHRGSGDGGQKASHGAMIDTSDQASITSRQELEGQI